MGGETAIGTFRTFISLMRPILVFFCMSFHGGGQEGYNNDYRRHFNIEISEIGTILWRNIRSRLRKTQRARASNSSHPRRYSYLVILLTVA